VRIISRRRLRDFAEEHPDAKGPLDAWYQIMRRNRYQTPHELREHFSSASFLGERKTVFNIGGDKYRLVVDMRYDLDRVYIRHVLTHDEYERKSKSGEL
jgi:mRNA interferase HigB